MENLIHRHGSKIAYMILVGAIAWMFLVMADDQTQRTNLLCVTAWETRENVRDAVAIAARGNRQALVNSFEIVVGDTDRLHEFAEVYAEQGDLSIERAIAQIPDPDCNYDEAKSGL